MLDLTYRIGKITRFFHTQVQNIVSQLQKKGGTALVVADEKTDRGVIYFTSDFRE